MKFDARKFVDDVDAIFGDSLREFGFVADGMKSTVDSASRTFRSGDPYIEITANCHFRDWPPECQVILGEGSDEMPECDWNAIALWRLTGGSSNYPIKAIDELPALLGEMCVDLLEQAEDFLTGDLSRFYEKRAEQNRDREPYKIYAPQPDGTYTVTDEPASLKLRERYSRSKKA